MEHEEITKGYVYCSHCDNVVSRSTFKRHERKRYSVDFRTDQPTTSENDDGEYKCCGHFKVTSTFKLLHN